MIHLSFLIEMMAGAETGCTYDLDVPWPLHYALTALAGEDEAASSTSAMWTIPTGPVDDAGIGVPGLVNVMHGLRRGGRFVSHPDRSRLLVQAPECQAAARRAFLRLDARASAAIYRAARFWATDALTLSKNFETAAWSRPPTYWMSPPKPRQLFSPVR